MLTVKDAANIDFHVGQLSKGNYVNVTCDGPDAEFREIKQHSESKSATFDKTMQWAAESHERTKLYNSQTKTQAPSSRRE